MTAQPFRVLLVEDNPADAELTRDAMNENRPDLEMSVVIDGVQAIEYVRRSGPYTSKMRPDLILLDLNIPRVNGKEVLAAVKAEAGLRMIPIIILTSSSAEKDIFESYELGANCYVIKPLDLHSFQEIVGSLVSFWFKIARLPRPGLDNSS